MWFRSKPSAVRIWLTDADTGERYQTSASPRAAAAVAALQTQAGQLTSTQAALAAANRCNEQLRAESDALIESARVMQEHRRVEAQAQQRRIEELHGIVRGLTQQLDKSQAEVKRLDARLVQVEAENLQLHGELATAEEQLAGYRLAVGS